MKCWICSRETRGFGHADGYFPVTDRRRHPRDWVFCSRRCQDAFHTLYCRWISAGRCAQEVPMIGASEVEIDAMHRCLKAFGSAAGEIGFEKPLGAYSEAQALHVIDAIVTCFTEAMVAHHEARAHAPVRGGTCVTDPLADLANDLPWERG